MDDDKFYEIEVTYFEYKTSYARIKVKEIYCAPGNAGISSLAECVPIQADDMAGLADFAAKESIDSGAAKEKLVQLARFTRENG